MIPWLISVIRVLLKVTPTPPHVPAGATEVQVFRASPRYVGYRYLAVAAQLVPVVVGALALGGALAATQRAGHDVPTAVWVLVILGDAGAVLGAAVALVSVRLEYEYHCYVMTDRGVRIRRGILEQVEATLTFANVQNVRVVQGPLERLFGIASVVVDTAGGNARRERQDPLLLKHRGVIRGVENAHALRDKIRERMRLSRSAGLGDPDDHSDRPARPSPSGPMEHRPPRPSPAPGPAEGQLELLRSIRDEARALAVDLRRASRQVEGA